MPASAPESPGAPPAPQGAAVRALQAAAVTALGAASSEAETSLAGLVGRCCWMKGGSVDRGAETTCEELYLMMEPKLACQTEEGVLGTSCQPG